jgi:hypothetical protein
VLTRTHARSTKGIVSRLLPGTSASSVSERASASLSTSANAGSASPQSDPRRASSDRDHDSVIFGRRISSANVVFVRWRAVARVRLCETVCAQPDMIIDAIAEIDRLLALIPPPDANALASNSASAPGNDDNDIMVGVFRATVAASQLAAAKERLNLGITCAGATRSPVVSLEAL